ncbi:hypothetical protein T8K17_12635 [Thalassobaculum sp. OXR-137]|uniref:hypothetical protein n=1 Tax=Thalassobaculum sp. OXR-137 TaxID=3100173 RepID=UPI002AC8C339|nr:hypothetical protein [Thalassobaculum sp. OXR-137]WPZ36975.1 hypothetical protein T8K17_12635 [Thalassobaculum sp. OXR-137]
MSDLQIAVAFIIVTLAVAAAGLFSWGISGMFSGGSTKDGAGGAAGADEDYATKLTRKNLDAKRTHTDA